MDGQLFFTVSYHVADSNGLKTAENEVSGYCVPGTWYPSRVERKIALCVCLFSDLN